MKRRFTVERVGRFRRSAARGMARAGFGALVIAIVLRMRLATATEIVACRTARSDLWGAAEKALFREIGR